MKKSYIIFNEEKSINKSAYLKYHPVFEIANLWMNEVLFNSMAFKEFSLFLVFSLLFNQHLFIQNN